MASNTIREDLYRAMRAAFTSNAGFIYRGRDRQTGPQAGPGTLLMLERRRWVRLVRVAITDPVTGQTRLEVAGGWLRPLGRAVLRDEITRRGDDMPARLVARRPRPATLATPATPARPAAPVIHSHAPAPARPAPVPAARRWAPVHTEPALLDLPARSMTVSVDPFTLIATGRRRTADISF